VVDALLPKTIPERERRNIQDRDDNIVFTNFSLKVGREIYSHFMLGKS